MIGAVFAADQPSGEDLLGLKGLALFEAADKAAVEEYSTADLIKIADKLGREQEEASDKKPPLPWRVFSDYFGAACERANPEELDQLVETYVRLQPGSLAKTFPFPRLAAAWISREISGLDLKVNVSQAAVPEEPEIREASTELISAWKLYKNLTRKADELLQEMPEGDSISFQANETAFYRLVDDLLLRRGDKLVERLAKFTWSGPSATGSETSGELQSIGIFMALLRERRLDEAVGAALKITSQRRVAVTNKRPSVQIEFLQKCGIDWEAVFAGELLRYEEFGSPAGLKELATHGSERALGFIIELALRAGPNTRRDYAYALAAFLPENSDHSNWSTSEISRPSPIAISTEAKNKIVSILQKYAESKPSRDIGEAVVAALARAKSPETKPALQILLKHSSERVSRPAAEALKTLGVDISPGRPVQFRLTSQGNALPPDTSVGWELIAKPKPVFDTARVDGTGLINIPRASFAHHPEATAIEFDNDAYTRTETPTFTIRIPIPGNLDEITEVDIKAVPVRLTVQGPKKSSGDEGSETEVRILKHSASQETPDFSEVPLNNFMVAIDTRTSFSMQKGRYDMEILAPGSARYRAPFDVIAPETTVHVILSPGADVHFETVRPDGERETSSEFLSAGKKIPPGAIEFDYETNTYRGLPVGDYVLHIKSSAEEAAWRGDDFAPIQPYSGKDIPFRITADTPLIELGEIRLDPTQ